MAPPWEKAAQDDALGGDAALHLALEEGADQARRGLDAVRVQVLPRSRPRMSYQAGMTMPPLTVTGREGAGTRSARRARAGARAGGPPARSRGRRRPDRAGRARWPGQAPVAPPPRRAGRGRSRFRPVDGIQQLVQHLPLLHGAPRHPPLQDVARLLQHAAGGGVAGEGDGEDPGQGHCPKAQAVPATRAPVPMPRPQYGSATQ